jgi:SpoVK/Ycf46/Vps4 family AAA+-type ATPase
MSYYMKSGNTFRIATKESMDLHEVLPAGNYVVKQDPFENFYIEQIENFDVPTKMYGDTIRNTERIISSFWNREKSTGVMLVGEKGSGKTLLSKNICIELAKQSVPTIVINAAWHGDKFNTLIQSIQQPCIVMFDEFEKVYNHDEQEALLTLLDGIYSTKKLFLLTSNDKWRVDGHMRNRPGRIFYMIDFKGLDETFIREYCYDNLAKPDLKTVDTIVNISSVFAAFNFDMLKAMIEEMNRYNESPQEAMRILNVKAEFDSGAAYSVEIYRGDRKADRNSPSIWNGTPLSTKEICVSYWFKSKRKADSEPVPKNQTLAVTLDSDDEDDEDSGWNEREFGTDDLVKFNNKTGQFIFEKNGTTMILMKESPKYFNFDAF